MLQVRPLRPAALGPPGLFPQPLPTSSRANSTSPCKAPVHSASVPSTYTAFPSAHSRYSAHLHPKRRTERHTCTESTPSIFTAGTHTRTALQGPARSRAGRNTPGTTRAANKSPLRAPTVPPRRSLPRQPQRSPLRKEPGCARPLFPSLCRGRGHPRPVTVEVAGAGGEQMPGTPPAPLLGSVLGWEHLQRRASTFLPGGAAPQRAGLGAEMPQSHRGSQCRRHPVLRRQQMAARWGAQRRRGGHIWVSGLQPSCGSVGAG